MSEGLLAPSSVFPSEAIARHKTAIRRPGLSLPVQCLLRDGLLDTTRTFFYYGCGRGQDVELLRTLGIPCDGWDPVHRPDANRITAGIVNLGYVINVIEDPEERKQALKQAWNLSENVLTVSAQLTFAAPEKEQAVYADGVVTTWGTFQKYYTQTELRTYLENTLDVDAVPAAPGVFYLFKEETARQTFLAHRCRRTVVLPVRQRNESRYEQNRDVL